MILFDHFTLHSVKLRELPDFVELFGLESTLTLLKSGLVTISPDFALFATDLSFEGHRPTLYKFSIGRVNSLRKYSIQQNIEDVNGLMPSHLSRRDRDRLFETTVDAFPNEPSRYGQESEGQSIVDFVCRPEIVKTAVANRLRQKYGFAITPNDFQLILHNEERAFHAQTDIADLCRLTENVDLIPREERGEFFTKLAISMIVARRREGLQLARRMLRRHGNLMDRDSRRECNEKIELFSENGGNLLRTLGEAKRAEWTVYQICAGEAEWPDDQEDDQEDEAEFDD